MCDQNDRVIARLTDIATFDTFADVRDISLHEYNPGCFTNNFSLVITDTRREVEPFREGVKTCHLPLHKVIDLLAQVGYRITPPPGHTHLKDPDLKFDLAAGGLIKTRDYRKETK